MKQLVENFTGQLREAIAIGEKAKLSSAPRQIRNVVITGLGGSGIGGSIVTEITAGTATVPILVNKDYFLPSFVSEDTLLIVCSYSGNTEETLEAMQAGLVKKAMIVCVTSGGKIAEIARTEKLDAIIIPGGMPPRSCLGYSLTQLLYILRHFNITGGEYVEQLKRSAELLDAEREDIKVEAALVTSKLIGKLPVIYAVDGYNGVATRFRQQINENSKMLCWHHILPEMNHNELVGWTERHDNIAVILLRNETDYSRTQARIEISKGVFNKYVKDVIEIWSKGSSMLERSMYLIHLTDYISVMIAEKKQIDATEVKIIDHLKGELAKI